MVVDREFRREQITDYIQNYQRLYGYSPSVRDISSEYQMSISTTHFYLKQLIKEGVLIGTPAKARTWRVVASF